MIVGIMIEVIEIIHGHKKLHDRCYVSKLLLESLSHIQYCSARKSRIPSLADFQ